MAWPGAPALPARQQMVLTFLVAGLSVSESADRAGVGRTSVHEWLRSDPKFRASYNAWQNGIRRTTHAALLGIATSAVKTVSDAVAAGDAKLAYQLLRDMKMIPTSAHDVPASAPQDPALTRLQQEAELRQERAAVAKATMDEIGFEIENAIHTQVDQLPGRKKPKRRSAMKELGLE